MYISTLMYGTCACMHACMYINGYVVVYADNATDHRVYTIVLFHGINIIYVYTYIQHAVLYNNIILCTRIAVHYDNTIEYRVHHIIPWHIYTVYTYITSVYCICYMIMHSILCTYTCIAVYIQNAYILVFEPLT